MTSQQALTHTQEPILLEGELTIYHVARFKAELQKKMQEGDDVSIDLSQVTEIDTSGLQLLLAAHQAMSKAGKKLLIVKPSEVVREFAERCNFSLSFGVTLDSGDSQ